MNPLNISFWVYFIYFLLAVFLAFYIPGNFFIKHLRLSKFQELVLSTISGMVLWGWQGFVFGYLNIRWFSYIYLLIFIFLFIKNKKLKILKPPSIKILLERKIDYLLVFIILIGVFSQLTSVWLSGISTSKGLYFCCGMVPDNILNIAITNEIINRFPPFEPGYYGKLMTNYHYWGSLVMAELIRVFRLPLITTNYQYMTLFVSLFLGLTSIVFSQLLKLGKNFARWLTLLLYLGGDLVWFVVLIVRGTNIFDMHPLESGQQFLENFPRAFAVVVFFAALSIFVVWLKKKDWKITSILILLFASLIGFKVYLGLFVFPGLGILGIYWFYKRKYMLTLTAFLIGILSLLIYFPVNAGAGGLYFTGTWRFENFIVQGYFGNLPRLELARIIYAEHHNWLRVISYELFYALVFVFAIFGTKLIGLVQNKKSLGLLPLELNILLIPGLLLSFIIGAFFNQVSGGSVTFNFIATDFILISIYTALALFYFLRGKRKLLNLFLICVILVFTLARGLSQASQNIQNSISKNNIAIDNKQLEALNVLKGIKTNSLVLVDPAFSGDKSSPYVSFLTNQKMFLSGQWDELEGHSVNYSDRLNVLNTILYSPDPKLVASELSKYNVGYIFMPSKNKLFATDSAKFLKTVFENSEAKILEVQLH